MRLPANRIGPATAAELAAALRRHAAAETAALAHRRAALLREGVQTAGLALVIVAICLTLGALVERAAVLPQTLREILAGGISIAGWVALWRPLDLLLYEPWLVGREIRLRSALTALPVELAPRP